MIWQIAAVAGGVLTVAVLALLARNLRHSQALREEKATLRDHLNASPFACLILQSEGWWLNQKAQELLNHPDQSPIDTPTLLACINAAQQQALSDCLDALRYDQKPFSQSLETSGLQRAVYVTGMWSNSCAVLWMQDEGATLMLTERMAEMEHQALFLEKLLDAVPMPIWWRDPQSLDLSGSNNAYNTLLGVGDDPSRARDLARLAQRTGMAQTESRHLVLDGSRVAIDVTEAPVQGFPGAVVGIGRDMTALENLQMSLAEHITVQDQVLERLTSAIAIYGPDRRLKFYNTAYAEMWSLTPEFLDNQPSVSTVLETLRQRGVIPETSDFPAYKKSREALFTHLIDAREDMIHLLNGRTVHAIISPHPLGGLIYQYQDVTDQLALETSHNELIAVQRSTLNSLFEGVCVFGRDGRLKLFNSVFANMFDLDIDWLAQSPHISAAAEKAKGKLLIEGDWDGLKQRIITRISEPKARQGRMLLSDMRVLDYAYVPLPDGQCLLLYLDVTDTTRVAEALRERNRALENADLLKSQFIANMSYELRTPLNAIMGFAELLKMEMFGPLSDRQSLYVDDILSASTDLSELIGEILDLAAVQAGFMELDLQKVDIAVVMQDIVQVRIGSNPADQKAVVFDAIHPAPILADIRRINQALNCFMDDALYVLDRRDTLSVAVAHMEDQQICLTMTVPIRNFDEPSWAKSICGLTEKGMLEPSLATGADIGISLARSLIAAQGGSLSMTDDSQTLICTFPACPADV
jgi:signal transduction histidine kinase